MARSACLFSNCSRSLTNCAIEKSVKEAFKRLRGGDGRRVNGADAGEFMRVDERNDLVDRLLTDRVILEEKTDNKSGGSESESESSGSSYMSILWR